MKKFISFLLALMLTALLLASCGNSDEKSPDETAAPSGSPATEPVTEEPTAAPAPGVPADIKIIPSSDKYRTYYQVWIGSFEDSNGDQIGDIPGLIQRLDYINDGDPDGGNDLGMDGIWLSPMMPSSTYHKYNIEDYFDIDPQFGTLDDFDALISACHDRGVVVIIDLVLNHSGAGHEFFIKACDELREGKEDGYAQYYNFSKTQDSTYKYNVSGTDYYYQGDFWDQMPDWNLSYDGTRAYFEEVTKFWLDRGVDGFRLDAVKYFTDSHTDGKEFLNWFYTMAQGYKSDVYMVGEDWDDAGNVYDMYESGIDSLFNFKFAGSGNTYIQASHGRVSDLVTQLKKYGDNIKKRNANAINANFLTNHDMVRLANLIDVEDNKFAAALYMLSPGNSFTYYGEEIGIEADNSNNDTYYRTAMIWDSENLPEIYANGVGYVPEHELGGVKQQLPDQDSLLNTYRNLVRLRLQNPELVRGDITETVSYDGMYCAGYVVDYEGTRLMVIHNGDESAQTMSVNEIENPTVRGWVTAETFDDETAAVTLSGSFLTIPAKTSVILKENKN